MQSTTQSVVGVLPKDLTADCSEPQFATYQNYKALVERAIDVFGDELTASRWLSMPSVDLDGQVPLQVAQRYGYALASLEPIFIRIEHGIDL